MSEVQYKSEMSAGVERTEITSSCLETRVLFLVRCKNDAWFLFAFFFVSEDQRVGHIFEKAFPINFDYVWPEGEQWWCRWVSQGLSKPD